MKDKYDIVLLGAGIMSATLAALLHETHPSLTMLIVEGLDKPALESSAALNNAGTGHSGFCELNYTKLENNKVDISKAVEVNKAFLQSKEFWRKLVVAGHITNDFINEVPHISFVSGCENSYHLQLRHAEMQKNHLFSDMEFTRDFDIITEWAPLLTEGRNPTDYVAATRVMRGTDVDYGNLTRQLMKYVSTFADVQYNAQVTRVEQLFGWNVKINDNIWIEAKHIFVGAGGNALTILQNSEIKEIEGYGGVPVSGQWLVCTNRDTVAKHAAKVYGKPSVGAPPMSVPHLDTRIINGDKQLIFGPYAGFSTKFLKTGSRWDLFASIRLKNIGVILKSALGNFSLTKYLVTEVLKGKRAKFRTLKQYYPNAIKSDWKLVQAGQRVQVIKNDNGKATIEFGTEVVGSSDGTIISLLGASPGASTAVHIMVDVIRKMQLPVNEGDRNIEDVVTVNMDENYSNHLENFWKYNCKNKFGSFE